MKKLYLLLLFNVCYILPNATGEVVLPKQKWEFLKPFGKFDQKALQRGFQVYKQVCSVCHGIKYISFRHLKAIGLDDNEIKALASQYQIKDGPNDEGEMFERPGTPADYLPSPYQNEKQARAANNGALPPDLSLIVKARKGGADYVYAILTGYSEKPKDFELSSTQHYNKYFPGHAISMIPPLQEGIVTYNDGTKASLNQMAKDVVTFLSFVSEPESEDRRRLGIKVLLYSLIMTLLFYFSMKKVWRDIKKK